MDESPVAELERTMQRVIVAEWNRVHGPVASVMAFCGDQTGARNEQVGAPLTHVGRGVSFARYGCGIMDWDGGEQLARDVEYARIYAIVLRSVTAAELHRSQFTDAELETMGRWMGLSALFREGLQRTAVCVGLVRVAAGINAQLS